MALFLQLVVNGVYAGAIYAMLGLSFAIIFSTTKLWHFAQGAVYAGSALVVLSLAPTIGLVAAVICGAIVAGAAGWACQAGIYEPLGRRGASMLVMVMASLGLTIIVENLLSMGFGPSQQTLLVNIGGPLIVGGVVISHAQLLAPIIAVVVIVAVIYLLTRTRLGRRVQALINDEELLTLQGVSTRPIRRACMTLGSALLPLPAVLLMLSGTGVSSYIGLPAVLIGAMALFLGGINSFAGAAIGGFMIGFVENVALYFIPSAWQAAVTYSIFFVVILLRPTGLFGRRLVQTSV